MNDLAALAWANHGSRNGLGTLALLALLAWTTWKGQASRDYQERLLFRPERILGHREYYRLLSSGLIHADWLHFGFNALTLAAFGEPLERAFGLGVLWLLFFGSVLIGSLVSLWLHRYENYRALGASGGACGVLFATMFLFPGSGISSLFLPVSIPGYLYAPLFILGSYLALRKRADNIGHDAHLGGALGGLAIALLLYPRCVLQQPVLLAVVVAVSLGVMFLLIRFPDSSEFLPRAWSERPFQASERYQQYDEALERARLKERIDQLLDKVADQGLHRLSDREQRELKRLSEDLKRLSPRS